MIDNQQDIEEQVYSLNLLDIEYLYIALGLKSYTNCLHELIDLSLYIGLQNKVPDRIIEIGKKNYLAFKEEFQNHCNIKTQKHIFDTKLFINKHYKSIEKICFQKGINDLEYKLLLTTLLSRNQ